MLPFISSYLAFSGWSDEWRWPNLFQDKEECKPLLPVPYCLDKRKPPHANRLPQDWGRGQGEGGEKVLEIVKPSLREKAYAEALPEPCAWEEDKKAASIASSVRALANQGKLAEALAACEEAIAADKLDPELYYLRAIIFQEQNRADEAMVSFKAALYIEPNFVPVHFAMGNLLLHRGNRHAAKKCFENVLALLSACRREDVLPGTEGLTAGRFREIIQAAMQGWE